MQFTCESGRIVLCLKNHEWNKSAISSMFKQVASSTDFVNTWETEVINSSQSQNGMSDHRGSDMPSTSSDRSTRKSSTASTETGPGVSSESNNSQDGSRRSESDRSTRKRSAATSSDLFPNTESDEIICGPPSSKKQCDYMSERIDQRIECCRKGI